MKDDLDVQMDNVLRKVSSTYISKGKQPFKLETHLQLFCQAAFLTDEEIIKMYTLLDMTIQCGHNPMS